MLFVGRVLMHRRVDGGGGVEVAGYAIAATARRLDGVEGHGDVIEPTRRAGRAPTAPCNAKRRPGPRRGHHHDPPQVRADRGRNPKPREEDDSDTDTDDDDENLNADDWLAANETPAPTEVVEDVSPYALVAYRSAVSVVLACSAGASRRRLGGGRGCRGWRCINSRLFVRRRRGGRGASEERASIGTRGIIRVVLRCRGTALAACPFAFAVDYSGGTSRRRRGATFLASLLRAARRRGDQIRLCPRGAARYPVCYQLPSGSW